MKQNVLIIGVRRRCYKAAIKLGHNVFLWSDGPLHDTRKKNIAGWIETPYVSCAKELTNEIKNFLQTNEITRVIANSEETVILGARVRKFLKIKPLGLKLTERFHNKYIMKNCAKEAGIPVTNYKLIDNDTTPNLLVESLGLPLVIKPVDESGAQDVKIAKTIEDVVKFMDVGLLAEAFVDGSEVSVESFVDNGIPIFHNCTEYLHQWRKSAIPANIDKNLLDQILELNDSVIKHFKLDRGMTHAEFYLTRNGPVFGEIAVRPPGGYYMELIQKVYGIDTWKTYVQLSCGDKIKITDKLPKGHAAVVMFHPGEGTIKSIEGEEVIREHLTNIIELKIRRKPGDLIEEHTNTSNEVGHILFWENTHEELLQKIEFIEENLIFNMTPSKEL